MRALLLAAGLAVAPAGAQSPGVPRATAAESPVPPTAVGGMVSLSLIEALAAVRQPQLAGIFSFVAEKDAPFAFADFLARDRTALKRYLGKLDDDRAAANGLTEWDHSVCASLVNLYASPLAATFGKPDQKRMSKINQCVLASILPLEEIVARRKR